MQPYLSKIHQQAVRSARQFHRSEFQLIEAIHQVDSKKVYRHLGHANLFSYCVKELRLSEGNTYAFIKVARKSVEIPEIKKAIGEGKLSVSKAKRVMAVISKKNQEEWIEKAATLPQRSLEQEVVRVSPRAEKREGVRTVSAERSEVRVGLDREQAEQLRQVQDLVSQRLGRAATLEDCMKVMMGEYIERYDPVRRAQRRGKPQPPYGRLATLWWSGIRINAPLSTPMGRAVPPNVGWKRIISCPARKGERTPRRISSFSAVGTTKGPTG